MAVNETFTVAVELGSSEVSVIAGRKDADGGIKVLASFQEPSNSFIRKGRINNVDKMTQFVISMKERLEKQLKYSVSQVYVGVGGMGMHTIPNKVERLLSDKTKVTEELIAALLEDNKAQYSGEKEVLDVVPQEYTIGTQKNLEPVGMVTDQIVGNYLNIITSSAAKQQISACFKDAGLSVAGTPISTLSLSKYMTSESERRSGCVFVDMGAETTSVAIYKNNLLRHLAVIPLGGANITRDLASVFQIDETEAETLKLTAAAAMMDASDVENRSDITLKDGRSIRFSDFFDTAQARLQEIIANIEYQVDVSGFHIDALIAGFILTGGVSQTKNIEGAFSEFAKVKKITVRQNLTIQARSKDNSFNKTGSFNAVLAMLDTNNANCCGGALGEAQQPQFFTTEEGSEETLNEGVVSQTPEVQQPTPVGEEKLEDLEKEERHPFEGEAEESSSPKEPSAFAKSWKKFTDFFKSMVEEEK